MKQNRITDKDKPAHLRIGAEGEQLAADWLLVNGYKIIERNYRKKWGEIDIIAEKSKAMHFVEVKTVSYETREKLNMNVSRGTHRPEDNVHHNKLARLGRAIETWVAEHRFMGNIEIDVLTVWMVPRERFAVVELIENVVVE